MKIETALARLEQTDAELIKVVADATAELRQVQSIVASHDDALKLFRTTGQGILDAVTARAWIEDFDRLVFPSQAAINAVSASSQREIFFAFQNRRLAADAREDYIRQHADSLADALQTIVTHRSRNRDKWHAKMADDIGALERRQLLNDPLTVEESRRLEVLDRQIASADETFGQSTNAISKFLNQPSAEFFEDARRLANQIDFEATP